MAAAQTGCHVPRGAADAVAAEVLIRRLGLADDDPASPGGAWPRTSTTCTCCTQCRMRKVKCDRNVPHCASCVQRGIRHLCCWGDERDERDATAVADAPAAPPAGARGSAAEGRRGTKRARHAERCAPRLSSLPSSQFPFVRSPDAASLAALWTSDRDAWWRTVTEQLYLLPDSATMESVLAWYMRELDPIKCCINGIIFAQEMALLFAELRAGDQTARPAAEPDRGAAGDIAGQIAGSLGGGAPQHPARALLGDRADGAGPVWGEPQPYGLLALMLALVHTTCGAMTIPRILLMRIFPWCETAAQVADAMERTFDASLYFLSQADCLETPTLWVLQTVLLYDQKYITSKSKSLSLSWNATAIHMAHCLGLNRLGTAARDPCGVVPPIRDFSDDLARRELARRIWNRLVMIDWTLSGILDYFYAVPEELNHTGHCALLDDAEAVRLAELPPSLLHDDQRPSPHQFTNALLEVTRIARRVGTDLLRAHCDDMSPRLAYDRILTYDAAYRAIVDALPPFFRFDGATELTESVRRTHMHHPYLSLQRIFLQENVHFRILVLHHPYLVYGLADATYQRSVDACVEGARVTVAACEELQRTDNPNLHIYYLKWHVFFASVVLQRVASFLVSHPTPCAAHCSLDVALLVATLEKALPFLLPMRDSMFFDHLGMEDPIELMRSLCAQLSQRDAGPPPDPQPHGSDQAVAGISSDAVLAPRVVLPSRFPETHPANAVTSETARDPGDLSPFPVLPFGADADGFAFAGLEFLMMSDEFGLGGTGGLGPAG
ncbi:hypothetical protein MSPP1_004027 [Malassezia sp. CBS 17886]|nr:hypothetical protein MSPP1_004027 [Malassezia sp. CBS 17886]